MPVPDLDAVKAYMGPSGMAFSDEQITQALAAETAAQQVEVVVGTYPPDIAQALMRRVHRNLTMRSAPLGFEPNGEFGAVRIGSTDPEVRRLEAPYRRWARDAGFLATDVVLGGGEA